MSLDGAIGPVFERGRALKGNKVSDRLENELLELKSADVKVKADAGRNRSLAP